MRRLLDAVPFKRRLMSGAAWAMGLRVLTSLVSLAVSGLMARLLTPEDMGIYFLMFSVVMVAIIFSQLGFNRAAVRAVAHALGVGDRGGAYAAIFTVFRYGVLGALLVGAALYFGLGEWMATQLFRSPAMAGAVGLLALWVVALTFQTLVQEVFRGFSDIRSASFFGLLLPMALSAAVLWPMLATRGRAELNEVLLVTVGSSLLTVAVALLVLWPRLRELRDAGRVTTSDDSQQLSIAWSLILSSLLFVFLQRADLWVLGRYASSDELAIYGAVARLIVVVTMPMMILSAVLPPLVAELYAKQDMERLQRVMRFTATMAAIPSTIILLAFMIFGDWLLRVVFGEFYVAGHTVLVLLSLGQLGNVWAGGTHHLLLMANRDHALLMTNIVCLAVAVGAALLSVHSFGMVGVAASFGAAVLLRNIIMPIYCWRVLGIKTWVRLSLQRPPLQGSPRRRAREAADE